MSRVDDGRGSVVTEKEQVKLVGDIGASEAVAET